MESIIQLVNQKLININNILDQGLVNEAYREYIELVRKIESQECYDLPHSLKAEVYISFAYFLFSASEFNSFFSILIKAQEYNYSKEEIESVLYEAFIEPNLNEFKSIYDANMKFLVSKGYLLIDHYRSFDELPYWLLPTSVPDEYYIYDKQQKIVMEKISLFNTLSLQEPSVPDAFSDFLIQEDWSWENVLAISKIARRSGKKTYALINNIGKFLSCLQGKLLNNVILSDVLIFDDVKRLENYLSTNNSVLPWNIYHTTQIKDSVSDIIHAIHDNRIQKGNRSGNRVLLSICIPSYNRGNRAYDNVMHLLQSHYDEELEFIISNNGTQNESKPYYDKIAQLTDTRVKYFAFDENKGFAVNLCKVCEMASGDFILLLSDEDLINFNALPTIMNILSTSKNTLSILKTSTTSHYRYSNFTAAPGKEALQSFMLSSNYISGIIYNNKLLKQLNGIEYVKESLNNSVCFWYPHMYWELLLCQYGNVQSTDILLVNEGTAEKTECEDIQIDNEIVIPYYASIEGRLEQHRDFTFIIKDLEISKQDPSLLREMYLKLCIKTLYLTTISINVFYKKTNSNIWVLYDEVYRFCSDENFYKDNINCEDMMYREDLQIITQIFENYKNHI